MKKFTKVAAILAASAILFGGMFMSCSDSDDSNDGTPSTPVSDKAPAPAVTFTSATKTVAKADLGEATAASVVSSDATIATATVSEGAVIIVSVKAGSATITATAEGYNDASIPVTVAANGAITLGTITQFTVKSSEPVTPPAAGFNYTFDFTTLGSNASDKKVTYAEDTYFDNAVFLYSKKEGLRIRKETNYINYNGTDANWTKADEGEVLTAPDRYCGFDASKTSASGDVTVTFGYSVKNSDNASDNLGALAIVDSTGKVLASKTGLKLKDGSDEGTISANIAKDAKAVLYFSRGGAGAGGIDVTAITAKTAE